MRRPQQLSLLPVALFFLFSQAVAQEPEPKKKDTAWSTHLQFTVISQSHSGFRSSYQGMNSLADSVEVAATSVTATLFIGRKLWKGSAVYLNPELSGGRGLSYAVGVAGALNGETYRIGDPAPVVSIARAYLQQTFALGKGDAASLPDGANQVAGIVSAERLVISVGKFSMSDFYDRNKYSHDPRSQFLNWSLMSNGAWDYPANTKGYTLGLVAELIHPDWAIRFSSVAVPKIANHPELEYAFGKVHSETLEAEHRLGLLKRPGLVRLLLSYTASRSPSYQDGIRALVNADAQTLNVISGNATGKNFGGKKTGICLNAEQEIAENIGVFARVGWNDGKDVTWAFTEIDQTAHVGLSFGGQQWKRKEDVAGIAGVINGISADHRQFLEDGGYGFIIGDGRLNYGHEGILELYYNAKLFPACWLTLDYQYVSHPGYNKDRGPVHVFGIRGHIEL